MGLILSWFFGILFFPITFLASWLVVHPQEEIVVLFWGKFVRVLKKPGLYWQNMWGRKIIKISTKRQAVDVPRSVVADGNANPIIVAGIITYRLADTMKAALDVEHADEFVKTQGLAVLKQVASKYPYEAPEGEHSLKSEASLIGREMVEVLQRKVDAAGAEVISFELADLAYAPEIAQSMLVRQAAKALLDARRTIVDGAVQIVHDAVNQLSRTGLDLTEGDKARLITNLLTVICGDAKVQPTFPIHAPQQPEKDEGDRRMVDVLERIARNTTRAGQA